MGYREPELGFASRGRPPERSSLQTGRRPRDQASWTIFSIGRPNAMRSRPTKLRRAKSGSA